VVLEALVGVLRDVDRASAAAGLHLVRQRHVTRPHVESEAFAADEAAQGVASVNAHAHVHVHGVRPVEVLDLLDHFEAHFNAALGVLELAVQAAADAVVAIAKGADFLAVGGLADLVEASVEVIEKEDKLFGCLGRGHACEADYVGEKDAQFLDWIDEERPHLVDAVDAFFEVFRLAED